MNAPNPPFRSAAQAPPIDVRAVLFDLDETLIAQRKSFEDIGAEAFAAFEEQLAPVTRQQFWQAFWPRAVDMWHLMIEGVVSGAEARYHTMRNALRALEADLDLAGPLHAQADQALLEAGTLYADALATLRALRAAGYTIGVVTNGYSDMQRRKIARHELGPAVDFIVVSEEARAHKPDPRIFEQALVLAAVAPDEAVYVGDLLHNDVGGAMRAGMHALLHDPRGLRMAQRAAHPDAPAPHAVLDRLGEVLPIVGLPPLG